MRAAAPPGATRKPAAAQQRPRAPQLLQEALCSAPAARKAARKLCVLRLPHEASRGPAAPMRAAARQKTLCTAPATRKVARKLSVNRLPHEASRGAAAPTRAAAPPGGSEEINTRGSLKNQWILVNFCPSGC